MPDLGSANLRNFRTAAKQMPRRSDRTVGQCPVRAVFTPVVNGTDPGALSVHS